MTPSELRARPTTMLIHLGSIPELWSALALLRDSNEITAALIPIDIHLAHGEHQTPILT